MAKTDTSARKRLSRTKANKTPLGVGAFLVCSTSRGATVIASSDSAVDDLEQAAATRDLLPTPALNRTPLLAIGFYRLDRDQTIESEGVVALRHALGWYSGPVNLPCSRKKPKGLVWQVYERSEEDLRELRRRVDAAWKQLKASRQSDVWTLNCILAARGIDAKLDGLTQDELWATDLFRSWKEEFPSWIKSVIRGIGPLVLDQDLKRKLKESATRSYQSVNELADLSLPPVLSPELKKELTERCRAAGQAASNLHTLVRATNRKVMKMMGEGREPEEPGELSRWLANQIKTRRHNAGYSQKQLAERTGMTLSQIANYELAKSTPRAESLRKIAVALGAKVSDFLPSQAQ